jgi:hypothetical protein
MATTPSSGSSSRPMSPRMRFYFSRIFPWGFILMGAIVFIFGVRNFTRARESASWPTVEGRVAHSEMTLGSGDESSVYHASVLYNYKLSGVSYSSDRIGFGDFDSSDSSHAQAIVNRYPVGTSVQVHYNPQTPNLSVLETGVNGATYFLAPGGALFLISGCLMLWGLPKLLRLLSAATPSDDSSN